MAIQPYEPGVDPELDADILAALSEVRTSWRSFAEDPMPTTRRHALQWLVYFGLAQMKVTYTITNTRTGRGVRQQYIVSGDFHDWLAKFMQAQCPLELALEPHLLLVRPDHADWMLALSGTVPANPDIRSFVVAEPMVLKDGTDVYIDANGKPTKPRKRRP